MKNIFVFILALSALTVTRAQTKNLKNNNSPVFKFDKEVIDYGTISQNADGKRVFKFTNVGKSPLIITNIQSSCGCTVPKKPEAPIMPGKQGEIQVKYATNRVGNFQKSLTITSNASEPIKVVSIKGRVTPLTTAVEKKKDLMHQK